MSKGIFITIEGGDGAGKTTLISRLNEQIYIHAQQRTVPTREPGGSPIAEAIRSVILDRKNTRMDPRTEALLYAAARRQHLMEIVKPAIESKKIVICDRFVDSSLAYQGYARGLGMDEVWEINRFATDGYMPDVTLYLDIDPVVAMSRIHANSSREVNRLDLEKIDFHQKVREGYLQVAARFPNRIFVLDASQTPEALALEAWKIIEAKLSLKGS
ncbi:dTMP kinase [Cohnella panacarvi]|uniref:dTMP kinase n=1 Tax=Cohnella panacarvi TaxID=400776 RepID=UPI00047AA24A|nr:dTMP kinase [Cohnella panacarvi]